MSPKFRSAQFVTNSLFSSDGGQVSVEMSLPRTAFVPGESVDIHAVIANGANKKVKGTRAWLKQVGKNTSAYQVIPQKNKIRPTQI